MRRTDLSFMLLLSVVIAVAMQIVGLLLIVSMLILPAAAGRRFASTPEQMAALASDIKLTVLLYDADGVIVDAVSANLTSASLGPDEQGQFSATFESARDFQSMKFDVSSFDIERNDG